MCYLEPLLLTSAPEEILSMKRNLVATGATGSERQPSEVDGEAGGGSAFAQLGVNNGEWPRPAANCHNAASRRSPSRWPHHARLC